MTSALRSTIDDLATSFAAAVVAAIKGATLDDILTLDSGASPAGRGPGRPRGKVLAPKDGASKAAASSARRATPAPSKRRSATTKASEGGRLGRRSADDIEAALELVVALLKSTKAGLRSEQIRGHLGVRKEELPRILKHGLTSKVLTSKGEKRATMYVAA